MAPGTDGEHLVFVAGDGPPPDGYVVALGPDGTGGWSERHRRPSLPGALTLTQHPSLNRLYVAGSDAARNQLGYVAVLGSPELNLVSTVPSGGHLPCYLSVDPSGHYLVVVNYLDGELVVFELTPDGDVGEVTHRRTHPGHGPVVDRQDRSHVHQAVFDPAGRYLLVTDLGTDRIHSYTLGTHGRLHPGPSPVVRLPAGHGPRHLAFVGTDKVVTTDELSSTVSWYDYAPETGRLTWRGSEPTVDHTAGNNYPSELVITNDATVCLVGNRGNDTIAVFSISEAGLTRTAELEAGGRWPQHLTRVDGTVWCALRDSDRIRAFRVTGSAVDVLGPDIQLPRPNWILVSTR